MEPPDREWKELKQAVLRLGVKLLIATASALVFAASLWLKQQGYF